MMKPLRRFSVHQLLILGIFAGFFIVAILAAPRMEKLTPAPDSHGVPSTARISLTFNQPMDVGSVEVRMTIDPPLSGHLVWDGNTLVFEPLEPWPEGSTVTVQLAAGARSTRFLPMLRGQSWSFTVGAPRILYLWPAGDQADLYTISLDGSETTRLTETPLGVIDYTLSYDGNRIIYAEAREDGGSDLRLLDLTSGEQSLVYPCPERVLCQALALEPEGNILAFERLEFTVGAAGKPVLGASQVWMISTNGEVKASHVGVGDHITSNPSWSPTGWLAYYDNTLMEIALVDATLDPTPPPFNHIPNNLGLKGSWSPEGVFLLMPEIVFPQVDIGEEEGGTEELTSFYSHLYQVEVTSGITMDLTGGQAGRVEDASPVYSPDGEWIAFTRKYLEEDRWTLGRQLWLMRPDGSESRQLTDESFYGYSSLAWSPDSSTLVCLRKNRMDMAQPGEIWLYEIEGGVHSQLAVGGYLPQWIP